MRHMPRDRDRTPRSRTGLRNRGRRRVHAYKATGKAAAADFYGSWINGRMTAPDRIAGRMCWQKPDTSW